MGIPLCRQVENIFCIWEYAGVISQKIDNVVISDNEPLYQSFDL